ncbi:MAG: response regulator transcription factor [Chloroflexota bacterium]|nr:response regulator transcription factor [Chloroflexota bacterium]
MVSKMRMIREGEMTETGGTSRKLAVFIADNQPLYRQAIRQVLADDMEVVGESAVMDNVWSLVESLSPDIALVDISASVTEGLAVAREVASRCRGAAVVVLSAKPDDDQLFQAIKSGAAAFLSKDVSAESLVSTLRQVAAGEFPINDMLLAKPNTAKKVLQLFNGLSRMGQEVEDYIAPLSRREREILQYIANGFSNKRIAFALGISEQTIKNHITSILRKLNANDRTHAVVLAMRMGLLNARDTRYIPDADMGEPSPKRRNLAMSATR